MSNNIKVATLLVERGVFMFGQNKHNPDGTISVESIPDWTRDSEGNSIIVCSYDTDTGNHTEAAAIFAAWDSAGIEKYIMEKMNLTRRNFPTPEEIYKAIKDYGYDICEICCETDMGRYLDCSICPIEELKLQEVKTNEH